MSVLPYLFFDGCCEEVVAFWVLNRRSGRWGIPESGGGRPRLDHPPKMNRHHERTGICPRLGGIADHPLQHLCFFCAGAGRKGFRNLVKGMYSCISIPRAYDLL
jgi:hypothetical protein